uniref:VWFA and cache domain-containing protein 1-like n=1 Tax=Phallusia mammillata TaxID=59560 RepID=A0A6F9D8Y6_9ASCI|nr:VWFA and cache domain-containing protein 1-like [Phallusia mammillata]
MGVDIVTTYFYYLLQTEYPACGDGSYSCLLIDQGGFVIIAPQFLDENTNHYDRHLADLEPSVASVLIDNNVLQTKTCTNVASGLVQKTYFISSTQAFYSGTTGELNCRIFELSPLSGTNAFLLTIGTTVVPCVSVIHNCDCNLVSSSSGAIATPSCPSATLCTCPCTTYNTEFQPCYNNYSFTSPQPCTPETPELNLVATTTVDLSSLPVCYEIDFNSPGTSGSVSVGLIVGCVLGGIALLFFLGAWYDHHQRKKKSSALPSQTQTQSRPPPPPPQFTVQPTAPPTNHYQNVNFAPDQVNYVPPPPPYSSL